MQKTAAVGIFVDVFQNKTGPQLAADLFLDGVGELNAQVMGLQIIHLLRIPERIKGETELDRLLVFSENEIDAVVQAAHQKAARFQDPPALLPHLLYIPDIAVGQGMEDQVKGLVIKGQGQGHVRPDGPDLIMFPLCDQTVVLQLFFGIVQDRTHSALGSEYRHLLSAAAGKPQNLQSLQGREPVTGHITARRQADLPVAQNGILIILMVQGPAALPPLFRPAVENVSVDILIAHSTSKYCFQS